MRLGEVSLASRIEEVLDSVEVEKESVAAAAGKEFEALRENLTKWPIVGAFAIWVRQTGYGGLASIPA
jgi:hypothetical protein